MHMRRFDRGVIKLVFMQAYMPLFLTVAEIYGRKVSKLWEKIEIFDVLTHPVEIPCTIFMVPRQNVRKSVPYIYDWT